MRKTLGNTGLKFCFYYLIFDFVKPKLFEVVYSPKKLGIIICLYHKSLGKLGNAEVLFFFLKDFIYLFLEKGVRERNITLWLPLKHLLLGTWPTTQTCALTGNQTGDPLFSQAGPQSLSHVSQGRFYSFLWPSRIPLCTCTTAFLFTHLLMSTWVASVSIVGFMKTMPQSTHLSKSRTFHRAWLTIAAQI